MSQERMDWLQRHKMAEGIVVDSETGDPVRAEYRTLSGGKYPVAYYYPDDHAVNLPYDFPEGIEARAGSADAI